MRATWILAAIVPALLSTQAEAQVYVEAPRVYVAPPAVYIPPIHIRQRVRYYRPVAAPVYLAPPVPPPVYAVPPAPPVCCVVPAAAPPAPPLPPIPPPVILPAPALCCVAAPPVPAPPQTPCCVAALPPPPPPPPPCCATPPAPAPACPPPPCCQEAVAPRGVTLLARKPAAFTARFGLGVRGSAETSGSDLSAFGIGGEMLYRVGNHVGLELGTEYRHSDSSIVDRTDIPVTLGVRLHIGKPDWILSPYFVFAAGVDYAMADLRAASDDAVYFDGQLGGGLELRLGQHVAITADARFDGRKRLDDPSLEVSTLRSVNGIRVHPLGDEYGAKLRVGVALYF